MKQATKSKPMRDAAHKLIRRTPKQARGQLRVDVILDAAERLTQTMSWEKISTNHIAKEAGIPIGSLYQFFANKHAIAHALVQRYVASVEEAFAGLPEDLDGKTPEELVTIVFNGLMVMTQQHQGLHSLLVTGNDASDIGQISAPIRDMLRSKIEAILAVRAPWMSAEERKVHALVTQVTNRAAFAQAALLNGQGNKATAKKLLQRAREMQIAYYDRILQEHEVGKN